VDVTTHKFRPKVSPAGIVPPLPAGVPATNQWGIGAGAAQQIDALVQDKLLRTPAQKKISSQLLYTIRMLRGQPTAAGVPYLETDVEIDDNNNLFVDIRADVSNDLLARLRSLSVQITNSQPKYRNIRALVPADKVEQIAGWPDIYFIRPRQQAITNRVTNVRVAPGFEQRAAALRSFLNAALPLAGDRPVANVAGTGQGSQSSEGDVTHKANVARSTYGVSGAGLKIGVLSDGVTNLALSQALGDLGAVTVLPGQAGPSGDEGTAILEVIHDLAPGARLYFATAFNSIESFAQNIHDLRTAGCDIIVDDVSYFTETRFQDGQDPSVYSCTGTGCLVSDTDGGIVVQAVNDVVADGALYFSSAANSGNQDDLTSGTWEGDFVDGGAGTGVLAGAGNVHAFSASPTTLFDTITAAGGPIILSWADPLGVSANDYDLYVLNSTGSAIVAASTDRQSGTTDPVEAVGSGADLLNNRVVVVLFSGQPRYLHVTTNRGTLAIATAGATYGHNAANQAFGVAATPSFLQFAPSYPTGPFPNPFSASNLAELFTSDGPRRIFFHADGTPITPGDFSSTGGTLLQKPDITAADGVSVAGVGSFPSPFYGTSAAAPHAAAIAALIKSAKPTATGADVRTALTSTAIDIMGSGWDRDAGSGIVMADAAIASLGTPAYANPDLGAITASENPGNGDGYISAGEGAKLIIPLQNKFGAVDATNVTATLTTSATGVIITQPNTVAYPSLVAGSRAGSNAIAIVNIGSFTFTLASDFPACGTPIEFTLTVNYTGGPSPRVLTFTVPTGPPPVSVTNVLGTTPTAVTGVTTLTGTQTGRITRNGVASTCEAGAKAYPGTFAAAGSRAFDSYTFTACRDACAVVELTPPAADSVNFFATAYSPSFNPGDVSSNYVADAGSSSGVQSYAFNVTAGNNYTVAVHEVNSAAGAGQTYDLLLPGCAINCAPVNQLPLAQVHDVTVTATVSGTADASIDNGSSDPDGDTITLTQTPAGPYSLGATSVLLTVVDTKGATAQASANVTVVAPDLTVTKAHTGSFVQGQTGATYTLTANNVGTAATSGTVTLSDTLPAGLTATAITGTGWTCSLSSLSCTRSDALAVSSSYPPVTVTVDVASNAGANLTNTAAVSGGGDPNATNDSASDATTVIAATITVVPDSATATVVAGQSVTVMLTVTGNVDFASSSTPACSTTAPLTSCQFSPSTLTVGTTAARVGVTMLTTGPTAANRRPLWPGRTKAVFATLLGLPMIMFLVPLVGRTCNRKHQRVWLWMGFLLLLLLLVGCGGGLASSPFTTPGTYPVQVTVASGTVQGSATINLTVTQ
jgi:hypothetical protein